MHAMVGSTYFSRAVSYTCKTLIKLTTGYFHCNHIFENKTGAYPSGDLQVQSPSLDHKYYTREKVSDSLQHDKHSSLKHDSVNYGRKGFYSAAHRSLKPGIFTWIVMSIAITTFRITDI